MNTGTSSTRDSPQAEWIEVGSTRSRVKLIEATSTKCTLNWKELKCISEVVQRDLDQAGVASHEDYANVFDMWRKELNLRVHEPANDSELTDSVQTIRWYTSGNGFWEDEINCPVNDDGVLGGFGHVTGVDIEDSLLFMQRLESLRGATFTNEFALDCGAGIGRVTKLFLSQVVNQVDLLEQSKRLLKSSRKYIGRTLFDSKVRHLFCMGMQDFCPPSNSYDVIWTQWAVAQLTDLDLVAFLGRCRAALRQGGVICLKENVLNDDTPFEVDKTDCSIARCDVYFKSLFRQAGLSVIFEQTQRNFPAELVPVKMYALQ